MRNITVSVSYVQFRQARVWAAQHDTSVSATIQCLIENLPVVARAVCAILAAELQSLGISPSPETQSLINLISRQKSENGRVKSRVRKPATKTNIPISST